MKITDVRVRLVQGGSKSRLLGFCTITLDSEFVVRDLKLIEGTSGPFVAMPNRKLMDRCSSCGARNSLKARYCNDCGARLADDRIPRDGQGRSVAHADVAHPISTACRRYLEDEVIKAYRKELELSQHPDYKPPVLSDDDGDDESHDGHDTREEGGSDFGAGIYS